MKLAFKKTTCRVLVVSLLALSFQTAHAGLIGADQATTGSTSAERTLLLGTLDRSDVIQQLQTFGVDPLSRRLFWELIHSMSSDGVTVFVTTHYMEEAEYCNRLAMIYRGKMVVVGTPTELKQTAMKGELLLVEAAPLGPAVEALQTAPGVLDAAVFGNALHLVVRQADKMIPEIKRYLESRKLAATNIEKIRPTLEDVFVSLTTESAQARRAEVRA